MQCQNNLKQIALALHNYADTHPREGSTAKPVPLLPAGTVALAASQPDHRLSWIVEILPFLEKDDLYRRIDRRAGYDSSANQPALEQPLRVLQCQDWIREYHTESSAFTPYVGVAGVGADAAWLPGVDRRAGVFGYDRRTALADVRDGLSYTLLILESAQDNGPWGRGGPATVRGLDPADQPYLGIGRSFGGTHFAENSLFGHGESIGCNAALADGSVRFLQESISPEVLQALATVAGGEVVSGDW